jgi:hypothetical protein
MLMDDSRSSQKQKAKKSPSWWTTEIRLLDVVAPRVLIVVCLAAIAIVVNVNRLQKQDFVATTAMRSN